MPAVCRLGDVSSHGGALIPPTAKSVLTNGRPTAHIGTLHACPKPFHGVTPVVSGCPDVLVEDKVIAVVGMSVTGCGAVMVTGSNDTEAC